MRASSAERSGNLYKLAVTTGMRLGELLALRWENVDIRNRFLAVRHTLAADENGKRVPAEPKTEASKRRIDLTDYDVGILRDQQQRNLEEGLRAEPWVFPAQPVVFEDAVIPQGPSRKEYIERAPLKRILKAAAIQELNDEGKFTFHNLRHTCATIALSAGVNAKVVQEMLGHSSIKITLDLYSHVSPTMQLEGRMRMSGLLQAAREELGARRCHQREIMGNRPNVGILVLTYRH
jgi:integrase